MSGGSYDYLYSKDNLGGTEEQANLVAMVERLRRSGYYEEAEQTEAFIVRTSPSKTLRDVWRAVEWCDSCDTTEADIAKAVLAHRGGAWRSPAGAG